MIHNHVVTVALATATASTATTYFAMTEQVQIYIVGTVATLIGTGFTAWLAYKAKLNAEEAKKISEDTGKAVNGKMEEFKKLAEEFFVAKGVAAGKAEAETAAALKSAVMAEGVAKGVAEGVAKGVVKGVIVKDQKDTPV